MATDVELAEWNRHCARYESAVGNHGKATLHRKTADSIEALETENERLRAVVLAVVETSAAPGGVDVVNFLVELKSLAYKARAALPHP